MMEEPPLMREPTLEFRTEIAEAIGSVGSEEELEEVLSRIEATVAEFARLEDGDREINREEAEDLLAVAHSWASLLRPAEPASTGHRWLE
jgi:ParB-like chromosome segregation protein Spo0J